MRVNVDTFNYESIKWKQFGDYTGFGYHLLNVDKANMVIDLLFGFEPNKRCFYHKHYHPTSTLVLKGEQHIFEPKLNGEEVHKVRKQGEFGLSLGPETHIEGGGAEGCVIYQNIRATRNLVYSVLNDDLSVNLDVTIDHFYTDFVREAA